MRLKALLILGPILALAGLGLNATLGQPEGDDPPPKKGPKDDRKGPPRGDRKDKDDRKGGPKDDGDGPPPHDERKGPDLRRILEDLDLTESQQDQVRNVMEDHHEKMRVIMEKSQRDLLAALKKALPAEKYRKIQREIERQPKGPPKKDRKGPPKDDGKDDDDRKGPPKKDRKGPPKEDDDEDRKGPPRKDRKGPPRENRDDEDDRRDSARDPERIPAPRVEQDGEESREP